MNKHTTTVTTSGNSIDTNSNKSNIKSESPSVGAKIRHLKTNDTKLNTWNWRIETDTAELFIGMFG
ncbi:hypothetical protein [Mucilaginibacter sp.]|uniref:hypothetical protein n=1 Tax=Mucilaginibacter sp. TaxID=1882438 RepID=UPI0025FF73D4|nr:hypothetical protein [Mucilaginibacter sp.]